MKEIAKILLFTLILMLLSCKSQKIKKTAPISDSSTTIWTDTMVSTNKSDMLSPEWYIRMPQKDGFLYSVGRASSSRITIAREKALMQAQVAMAKEVAKKRGMPADSLNTILQYSHLVKEKQMKRGNRWYCYVLLEMPFN